MSTNPKAKKSTLGAAGKSTTTTSTSHNMDSIIAEMDALEAQRDGYGWGQGLQMQQQQQ